MGGTGALMFCGKLKLQLLITQRDARVERARLAEQVRQTVWHGLTESGRGDSCQTPASLRETRPPGLDRYHRSLRRRAWT